jgi:hypothetical protein
MSQPSDDDMQPPVVGHEEMLTQIRALTAMVSQFSSVVTRVEAENANLLKVIERGDYRADDGAPKRGRKKIIDFKTAMSCRRYSGSTEDWADWSFTLKRIVKSEEPIVYETMTYVETLTTELLEDVEFDGDAPDDIIRKKASAELFDILCNLLDGEARAIVMTHGKEDCAGYRAWQALSVKCNAKTMARAIRLVSQVTNPPKIKSLRDVETDMNKWEEKVKTLSREFNENFSNVVRIGILTTIVPAEIADQIYLTVDVNSTYAAVSAKIRAVVSAKVSMMGDKAVPMDCSQVMSQQQTYFENGSEHYSGNEEDEVGAVGAHIQCHTCSGWGHLSRECPSKGKGKGKKAGDFNKGYKGSFQKGDGKTGTKGKGKGFAGKGYQGNCFKCGMIGHKAAECRVSLANAVDGDESEEVVGSVNAWSGDPWHVGAVNAERVMKLKEKLFAPTATSNHFSVLTEIVENSVLQMPTMPVNIVNKYDASVHTQMPKIPAGRLNRSNPVTLSSRFLSSKKMTLNTFHEQPPGFEHHNVSINGVSIDAVVSKKQTRSSIMKFNVTDVKKPLVSAVKICEAGNWIIMGPDGGYIENIMTGDKMEMRKDRGTFVVDVEYRNGEVGVITVDSGAGVSVWPQGMQQGVPMGPKDEGLTMTAANGTPIANLGTKVIEFRGNEFQADFARLV